MVPTTYAVTRELQSSSKQDTMSEPKPTLLSSVCLPSQYHLNGVTFTLTKPLSRVRILNFYRRQVLEWSI